MSGHSSCPKCGSKIQSGGKTCNSCGAVSSIEIFLLRVNLRAVKCNMCRSTVDGSAWETIMLYGTVSKEHHLTDCNAVLSELSSMSAPGAFSQRSRMIMASMTPSFSNDQRHVVCDVVTT